jgi:hypothetical protein
MQENFCINILLLGIFMQCGAGSHPQFDFHFAQNACICCPNSVYLHRRAGKPCPEYALYFEEKTAAGGN